MARRIYAFREVDGKKKLVLVASDEVRRLDKTSRDVGTSGPTVIPDIEPYEAVGFEGAPMVTSRSQHRELLKTHNCEEVGNEMPKAIRELKYRRENGWMQPSERNKRGMGHE